MLFLLWLHPFILSGVISPLISSSILGTYRPGEFIFQCPIFFPFHTVHGVLKARILKWFAIPISSDIKILISEDIKKRWQEYTEELYKKDLHDPDNHEGVITHTHLEPDILECEVRWALGSITVNKASGGDGIPVVLFQLLKDDAVKVLH